MCLGPLAAGAEVLLVVRHRGARARSCIARARVSSADHRRRTRRVSSEAPRETTGTSASASRVPVPSRPAADAASSRELRARECSRCPGRSRRTHARVGVRVERAGIAQPRKSRGYSRPLFETRVRLFSLSSVCLRGVGRLWGFMTRHIKNVMNERNAPKGARAQVFSAFIAAAAAAPPALFAPPNAPPRPRHWALGEALRAIRARGPPHGPRGVRPVPEHEPRTPHLAELRTTAPRHRPRLFQTPPSCGARTRRPRRRRPTSVSFDRVWIRVVFSCVCERIVRIKRLVRQVPDAGAGGVSVDAAARVGTAPRRNMGRVADSAS